MSHEPKSQQGELHAAALAGTAAVVGNRRVVFNRRDLQAGVLQRRARLAAAVFLVVVVTPSVGEESRRNRVLYHYR